MRNFILGLERLCLCCVSLLRLLSSLFFILLHKRMDQRPPRDGSANYSACRPRSSASHSSCCSVWSFSDKLGRRKKWQTRGSQHGLSSLFIPYYFLVSFDKLSFAQEKTLQTLCKNHFISQKICQQQILPNCRGNYERPLLPHHLCYILTYMTMYQQIVLKADMPEILVSSPPPMAHILQQRVIRKTC